jgi:hypothetical protein
VIENDMALYRHLSARPTPAGTLGRRLLAWGVIVVCLVAVALGAAFVWLGLAGLSPTQTRDATAYSPFVDSIAAPHASSRINLEKVHLLVQGDTRPVEVYSDALYAALVAGPASLPVTARVSTIGGVVEWVSFRRRSYHVGAPSYVAFPFGIGLVAIALATIAYQYRRLRRWRRA